LADPAGGLVRPLDLENDDWPRAFDDDVGLYRALAFADPGTFARRHPAPHEVERLIARGLPPTERKMAQSALANILARGALPDRRLRGPSIAALLANGPLRAARLVFRLNWRS
jgi:hypothetical protein